MNELIDSVRRGELDRMHTALVAGGGLVVVHSEQAEEAIIVTELALRHLAHDYGTGAVDVVRCATQSELALAFVQAVAATYLGQASDYDGAPWSAADPGRLDAFAQVASPGLYRAVLAPRELEPDDSRALFSDAVDALIRHAATRPTVMCLFNADELVDNSDKARRGMLGDVDQLLWTLRSRMQHAAGAIYVVLAGGTGVSDVVADERAAFYGWGTEIELSVVWPGALRQAVYGQLREQAAIELPNEDHLADFSVALAADIAELSAGSVLVAQHLINALPLALRPERAPRGPGSRMGLAHRAMAALLELNATSLQAQTRLLRSLHRNALPIATALARGDAPYSVVRHPTDASRALRVLHRAGIAVQREARQWRLTDPLLAEWLRQPVAGIGTEGWAPRLAVW
jgi:hypothetical protein